MKFIFTTLFLLSAVSAFAQRTITLTEDLVLTETLVISTDTNYEGNGFSISCNACHPAILVKNGANVHFSNILFQRGYQSWMKMEEQSDISWTSPRMKGHVSGRRVE